LDSLPFLGASHPRFESGHSFHKKLPNFRRYWEFSLMPRKTVETYPPFLWEISCLALIMGESFRSGHSLGLDEMAFACSIPQFPERFSGEKTTMLQNRYQGLKWAISRIRKVPFNHSCRKVKSLRPPIFPGTFLSGGDNGRVGVIWARFCLGLDWKDGDISERISGELRCRFQIRDEG
jgi:hypothetical protein